MVKAGLRKAETQPRSGTRKDSGDPTSQTSGVDMAWPSQVELITLDYGTQRGSVGLRLSHMGYQCLTSSHEVLSGSLDLDIQNSKSGLFRSCSSWRQDELGVGSHISPA